jgi:hypothetical protein
VRDGGDEGEIGEIGGMRTLVLLMVVRTELAVWIF